jgi:hypothetical protein
MKKVTSLVLLIAVVTLATLFIATQTAEARGKRNPHPTAVVYVTSQDLFFDTIVLGELPFEGPFQKLEMMGPTGLQTEFGPGDPGYVGGRWWVDVNLNEEMDSEDMYFLCPLLGPGRDTP